MNLAPETALRHYFGQADGPQGGWSVRRDAFSASPLEAVLSREVPEVVTVGTSGSTGVPTQWSRTRTWATGDFVEVVDPRHFCFHGRRNRLRKINGVRVDFDEVEHRLATLCRARTSPASRSTTQYAARTSPSSSYRTGQATPMSSRQSGSPSSHGTSCRTKFWSCRPSNATRQGNYAGDASHRHYPNHARHRIRTRPRADLESYAGRRKRRAHDRQVRGAYVSTRDSAVDLASLAAAISEDGLPADTGVVMGTNGAPEVAWLTGHLLGIKGSLSAITSGEETAAIADDHAHGLIRQGRADTVLVVCADEVGGARAHVLSGEPLCVS